MDEKSVVYERQTLYEEVWAAPMREVAKRYGVSDVALAKTCRKLDVPLPGRGYWAKQKVGKAAPRPPLPPPAELTCTHPLRSDTFRRTRSDTIT